MADENDDLPTGRLQRLWRLSSLTTQIATRTLGQKVKGAFQRGEERARSELETRIDNAERMVDTLGQLKGAVMKVGQMISLHDGEEVSPEVAHILSRLQSQAPTLPYPRIREQIERSLDAPPEVLFRSFSEAPVAAASLGQVHRAELPDGTPVAVKVQYPGIAETLKSDLRNLKALIDATGLVSRRFGTDGIYKEIQARLTEETNYLNEALNLQAFGRLFEGEPRVVVPRYHPRFSSEVVLTMDYIEGQPLQKWLETCQDPEARARLGRDVFDLFLYQLLQARMIHADPHHGNFLLLPDGRIGLLDFGCVKHLEPWFVDAYQQMARCAIDGDRPGLVRALVDVGFLADDKNPAANQTMSELCLLFMEPFLEDRDYDFGAASLHVKAREIPGKVLALGRSSFPPDALFLNRVFMGHYFLLRRLGARANWHRVILPHLGRAPSG